jgi:hypothetical protein
MMMSVESHWPDGKHLSTPVVTLNDAIATGKRDRDNEAFIVNILDESGVLLFSVKPKGWGSWNG